MISLYHIHHLMVSCITGLTSKLPPPIPPMELEEEEEEYDEPPDVSYDTIITINITLL